MEGKWAKEQVCFRRHYSTMDHLITLRIFAMECRNNKYGIFCCFVDFRKSFDTVPRDNLWIVATRRLYQSSFPILRIMRGVNKYNL